MYTTQQGQTLHKERLGGNNMGFTARLKGRTPPLLVDYLFSAISLKVGAPRAPQTPKAKKTQEGEVALGAEFPPSWSDTETDGGGSEGETGGGTPDCPRTRGHPQKKAKKIRLARRWLGPAQNVVGGGLKGEGRHIQMVCIQMVSKW